MGTIVLLGLLLAGHASAAVLPESLPPDLDSVARGLNESEEEILSLPAFEVLDTIGARVDQAGSLLVVRPIRTILALAGIRIAEPEKLSFRLNSEGASLCMVFETGECLQ
jgi:hypothetical protein